MNLITKAWLVVDRNADPMKTLMKDLNERFADYQDKRNNCQHGNCKKCDEEKAARIRKDMDTANVLRELHKFQHLDKMGIIEHDDSYRVHTKVEEKKIATIIPDDDEVAYAITVLQRAPETKPGCTHNKCKECREEDKLRMKNAKKVAKDFCRGTGLDMGDIFYVKKEQTPSEEFDKELKNHSRIWGKREVQLLRKWGKN